MSFLQCGTFSLNPLPPAAYNFENIVLTMFANMSYAAEFKQMGKGSALMLDYLHF